MPIRPSRVTDATAVSRLEGLHRIAGWAGGEACFATLDGAPVLYVNEAAVADFLDKEDRGMKLTRILRFESESAREAYARAQPWWALPERM